jgi:hypothetical protein
MKHVFKTINAWGDSYRAQEFYDYERPSVLDNGYDKVERVTDAQGKQIKSGEVSDDEIVRIFKNEIAGEESLVEEPLEKPEALPQAEWDAATVEEKTEIIRQQKEC